MFAEACLMQGWDLKCERNAGRRSGQTRFVSFLIPRFILVSGRDWLVFVLLVLTQSLGDELFKHWKDDQRSSCEFWIPVFQSGLRSSLLACGRPAQIWLCCGSISIVDRAPFLKSKRRAVHVRARVAFAHLFTSLASTEHLIFGGTLWARVITDTREESPITLGPKGARRSFSLAPARAATLTRAQVAALDGCCGQSWCRCYSLHMCGGTLMASCPPQLWHPPR